MHQGESKVGGFYGILAHQGQCQGSQLRSSCDWSTLTVHLALPSDWLCQAVHCSSSLLWLNAAARSSAVSS
jgi:hypothetical protein